MIVSINEAIKIYESIPDNYKSFYYHPFYLMEDVRNKKNLEVCFFAIQESHSIFYHAFYKGKVLDTEYYDAQSPYGYGGPIIIGEKDFKDRAISLYLDWCKDNKILVEFIRFHPILKNHLDYYGETFENRSTVYIDLQEEDILKTFSTRARTAVKKAKKNNLEITFSKKQHYINEFIKIYNQLMNFKHTSDEYFFDDLYYMNLLEKSNTHLISVLDEDKKVIASAIFFLEANLAEYHLSAATLKGKELNATNLLLYEFAIYAKNKGCKRFYLGGGNSVNENNPLLFFKRGFSKNEKPYFIGYTVHLKNDYNEIKKFFEGNKNNILFYR